MKHLLDERLPILTIIGENLLIEEQLIMVFCISSIQSTKDASSLSAAIPRGQGGECLSLCLHNLYIDPYQRLVCFFLSCIWRVFESDDCFLTDPCTLTHALELHKFCVLCNCFVLITLSLFWILFPTQVPLLQHNQQLFCNNDQNLTAVQFSRSSI